MEAGESLDEWLPRLAGLPVDERNVCIRDLIICVCTATYNLENVCMLTHYDSKPANWLAIKKRVHRPQLLLTNEGHLEAGPLASGFDFKLIDFGHAVWSVPHRLSRIPTIEFCPPLLLTGRRGHKEGSAADLFGMAYIFMIALNGGDNSMLSFRCPGKLRPFFRKAIDFEYLGLATRDEEERVIDSIYRYVVITFVPHNPWILELLFIECPALESIRNRLLQNLSFQRDARKFSLASGSRMYSIRSSTLFKSEDHAVYGLLFLMHPLPGFRLYPEEFVTFLV